MVSFMGIGLVDPILPAISRELHASQSQTMLLFTSYLFITGGAMFFTSWVSGRIGIRWTLLAGLALVVLFALCAGLSGSVTQIINFRAGWGLGNALFISTALAAIVGAATGGARQAIILYESALGVGMAVGPLLGGVLGAISWRGPFIGTAVLMLLALLAILVLLRTPLPSQVGERPGIGASFKALAHPAIFALGIVTFFYNFAFFVLLAYSPYPLEDAAQAAGMREFGAHNLGFVFFGWGLALAVASVVLAPLVLRVLRVTTVVLLAVILFALVLVGMAVLVGSLPGLIALIVVSGVVSGTLNTVLTQAVMEASDLPRNVASSGYSGLRFIGGAIAPAVAGPLAAVAGAAAPYWLAAGAAVLSCLVLLVVRGRLAHLS